MQIPNQWFVLWAVVGALGCQSPNKRTSPTTAHPHVQAQLAVLKSYPRQRPQDAVQFAGHWYQLYPQKVCWHLAQAICERMGGHLVCIESAAEQEFITTLAAGRYCYLGATDEAAEGTWRWVNGAPFQYTCWLGGQPNNYHNQEHWLATYTRGKWVDVADQGTGFWMPKGFICEWP